MRDFVRFTRRFLDYTIGNNRRIVYACMALVVGGYVTKAILALALAGLTDALVSGDRSAALWALAAVIPLMITSRVEENSFIGYVASHQYNTAAQGFEIHLLELDLSFPHVDHLEDPAYLDRYDLIRADTEDLVKVLWTWIRILAAGIQTVISSALLIRVHPALALFPLAVLPLLAADARAARILDRARVAAAADDRLEAALHALVTQPATAKETKVAQAEAEIDREAAAAWERSTTRSVRAMVRAQLLSACAWLVFGAAQVGVAAWVGLRVVDQQAALGELVLVITLGLQARSQLGTFVWNGSRGRRTGIAFRRYRELVELHGQRTQPPAVPLTAPDRLVEGIQVRGVTFHYPDAETPALTDVSLDLAPGQTLAIVGENGAGKSTLVKLLLGLYAPSAGSITADGTDLACVQADEWRARVAALFQDFARLQFSAGDAIGVGDLPRRGDTAALDRAVARANAQSTLDILPDGYETQLGRMFGGVELSGGQWQRLDLAQTMMRPAPLLLVLDEPASALDPFAEHELFERYAEAAKATAAASGTITVFVSHRFSTVRMAETIVVMDQGRIVEIGSHEELMRRAGLYSELYALQAAAYTKGQSPA